MTLLATRRTIAPSDPERSFRAARGAYLMRLDSARDQFIGDMRNGEFGCRRSSPASQRTYREHLTWFIEWLKVYRRRQSVTDFSAEEARAYLEHRSTVANVGMNTLSLDSVVLRALARWGVKRRYWSAEKVDDIQYIGKAKTLPRPYGTSEIDAMMALRLDQADAALRAVLYFAGLRNAEVIGLRLLDITVPRELPDGSAAPGALRVWGKGGKERVVPMHPVLWATLKDYLTTLRGAQLERPLLTKPDGSRWTEKMVQARVRAWGAAAKVAGPKPHRFRHTFATEALEGSPEDIRTLQELLGHASVATTQIYTKVSSKRKTDMVLRLRSFEPVTLRPHSETLGIATDQDAAKPAETQSDP